MTKIVPYPAFIRRGHDRWLPAGRLMTIAFLLLALPAGLRAEAFNPGKLDKGLDDPDQVYPIFVRFASQLLPGANDYESFCRTHRNRSRSELRQWVIADLHRRSDQVWNTIGPEIEAMQQAGGVQDLLRYWIVNGFACRASGKACRSLAASEHVGFVYRQRLKNVPLHQNNAGARVADQRLKKVYQSLIDRWGNVANQPFSSEGYNVAWNLKLIKADRAWDEHGATGKGVVVAICDSGLMVAPALTSALWKNPKEQLNGKDDDDNGYTDDIFGYDFTRNSWHALGDQALMPHGSMCAGIIAGRPLNKKRLITGIAPRAQLMVLRGMGHLKSYEYAMENGADILSMSYMWPGLSLGNYRGLYRLAHEHLAAGGIVAVGGAGNFGSGAGHRAQPKGKQIALPKDIPCVIAAAGILKDGSQPPMGSEGPCYWTGVKFYDDYPPDKPLAKPDVTGYFGGYPVWGRLAVLAKHPQRKWEMITDEGHGIGLIIGPQGNSFAGPHAAGVAALMLSVNPQLHPWQVKQLMEQTCRDIGPRGRDGRFGAGLLDAAAAVRAAKNAAR